MIITIDEFNKYTEDYNEDNVEIKTLMLESAQEKVEEYLGYELEVVQRLESIEVNSNYISLDQYIDVINSIEDSNHNPITDYAIRKNYIIFKQVINDIIYLDYDSGLSVVPASIKLAIMQIATLKLLESGKKIGITGIQNPDGIGNTFINYTNYDKWLQQIKSYRII